MDGLGGKGVDALCTRTPTGRFPGAYDAFQGTSMPFDSPLFLPILPVEPSPTTGSQHCHPLFHTGRARQAALSSVAKLGLPQTENVATEAAIHLPVLQPGADRETVTHVPDPAWNFNLREVLAAGSGPAMFDDANQQPSTAPRTSYHSSGKQSVANDDGYHWRKYGEKIVKGSPNPRSYYKCSHSGCTAKKIVERSERGDILNTEYKGDHTHPAPAAARTLKLRVKNAKAQQVQQASSSPDGSVLPQLPRASAPPHGLSQSLPMPTILFQLPTVSALPSAFSGMSGVLALPLGQPYDNSLLPIPDGLDQATEESPSKRLDALAAYAEKAEKQHISQSKRASDSLLHRIGDLADDAAGALSLSNAASGDIDRLPGALLLQRPQKLLQPPRNTCKRQRPDTVAGDQDESAGSGDALAGVNSGLTYVVEAETVEDGYRWRKYGQKFVKGSSHPRSYYKCTSQDCSVRKHVERSSHGSNRLLITYENTHNHAMPQGGVSGSCRSPTRTGHLDADGDAWHPACADNADAAAASPRFSHHPRGCAAQPLAEMVMLPQPHRSGHQQPLQLNHQQQDPGLRNAAVGGAARAASGVADINDLLPFLQNLPPSATASAGMPPLIIRTERSRTSATNLNMGAAGGAVAEAGVTGAIGPGALVTTPGSALLLDSLSSGALGVLGSMSIDAFSQLFARHQEQQAGSSNAWDPAACLNTPKVPAAVNVANVCSLLSPTLAGSLTLSREARDAQLPLAPDLVLGGTQM